MIKVLKSEVSGSVNITPSKSITQRAFAVASLCRGKSVIKNPSKSKDSLSSLNVVKRMGSKVKEFETSVEITGMEREPENSFNCGESGLCIRMFTPILSLFEKEIEITGEGSLLKRPVSMMESPLQKLGVEIKTNNGFPPIELKGKLKSGEVEIDGSITSQFLTGLLISLTQTEGLSLVKVKNPTSKPYIGLTLDILEKAGARIENNGYEVFKVYPAEFKPLNIEVEGDFSSACFMLVAGAIAGKVKVENIKPYSKQADRKILDVLIDAGCRVRIENNSVSVEQSELKGFSIDVEDCPDIVPSLIPLASMCKSPSRIKNINRLRFKESNRVEGLADEFRKIGVKIEISDNEIIVFPSKIKGGQADSKNDHRLAMALSVCGLVSEKGVEILNPYCVSKSYPEFFNHLKSINGIVISRGENES